MNAWLDDFNLHAGNEEKLMDLLERFFQICQMHGLFLSAKKCVFFSRSLKWCGRIINQDRYTLDPSRIQGLRDMEMPQTAGELSQFVHCCRWMLLAIPNFASRVAPLTDTLEEAHEISGKRTSSLSRTYRFSVWHGALPVRKRFGIYKKRCERPCNCLPRSEEGNMLLHGRFGKILVIDCDSMFTGGARQIITRSTA